MGGRPALGRGLARAAEPANGQRRRAGGERAGHPRSRVQDVGPLPERERAHVEARHARRGTDAGFERYGVDLETPDFVALCAAFSVPARCAEWNELADALAWAFDTEGPAAVVVETEIAMPS